MHNMGRRIRYGVWLAVALPPLSTLAQTLRPEDQNIDPVRTLPAISASDQRVIADWVQAKLALLSADAVKDADAALLNTRKTFADLYSRSGNTPAFQTELARQIAEIFLLQLRKSDLAPAVSRPLARILADMNRVETLPALMAGLQSSDAPTRYLSVRSLASLRSAIAADRELLERVLAAVRQVGDTETSPVVTAQWYALLSLPQQAALVFDPMLGILEKRLAARRGNALVEDGAELDAYEFFRTPGVLNTLSQEQKNRLVNALAVLLRFDAERYSVVKLTATETEILERCLDGIESVLTDLGIKGGDVRNELSQGGRERRAEVLNQARAWIGDKETQKPGALNAPPYNVPLGAM